MASRAFFVNVLPVNDRRDQGLTRESLLASVAISSHERFRYSLITVGDRRIDPWVVAQLGLHSESRFGPLVAVNPLYQHPLEIAKKIAALHVAYPGRSLALNLVTGSFFSEMRSVGDGLDQEERNSRLREFHHVLTGLLSSSEPLTFRGQYYQIEGASIWPRPDSLKLEIFVSGAFLETYKAFNNVHFVRSIRPLAEMEKASNSRCGLGLGILARASDAEAREAATRLFPEDRRGEMLFGFSLANNETPWNSWLKAFLPKHRESDEFFLRPLKNFWASSPYIVGSYETVARRMKDYENLGYEFFIVDSPASRGLGEDEATHVVRALETFNQIV